MRKLSEIVRSRLGMPPPLSNVVIAGHKVTIRSGSYPAEPDYDYAWQVALAQDARVVFDIGANQGQTALNVLLGGGVGCLVLVEANPEALATAAENLIRNGLSSKVRFISAFLSDTCGEELELFVVGSGAAGSRFRSHSTTAAQSGSHIAVWTLTMDHLVEEQGISPDLVIIDVEGAEHSVLMGARKTIALSRPRILVEMHSPEEIGGMSENAQRVLSWCKKSEYRAWYLAEGAELLEVVQLAHRGRCHLLLQTAELGFPEILRGIEQGASVTDFVRAT